MPEQSWADIIHLTVRHPLLDVDQQDRDRSKHPSVDGLDEPEVGRAFPTKRWKSFLDAVDRDREIVRISNI